LAFQLVYSNTHTIQKMMIQVVVRALEILEYVSKQSNEPVSLSEISTAVGLHQPTCANIVKTLVTKNYLEHLGRKHGYRLGANAYHLTGNLAYSQNLILAAKDVMENLTKTLNESSLLGILRNHKRYLLHTSQSDHDLLVRSRTETDIYPTATGRILMAFMPIKDLENIIQVIGLPQPQVWQGAQTKEDLLLALDEIRRNEMAFTLSAKHIVGVSVPIKKADKVLASLSVFLPESRYTPPHKAQIIHELVKAKEKINERLSQEE
jgi:DNA-binding IclR family transcriptional regulator